MATSSTNSTDNMIPPELEVGLREDNITFWHEHRGFTRPQLHGHRVGEAYASLKSFVTTRRASNDSSIESRLRLYATLLWKEMVRKLFFSYGRLVNRIDSGFTKCVDQRSN